VIWLASDPSLLSAAATNAIRTARKNGGVGISCISLFELGWLVRNQRIVLKTSLEAFLIEVEARFVILPITAAVTRIAVEFPSPYPLDPMDRIIGATARFPEPIPLRKSSRRHINGSRITPPSVE
jgi:PIN domain nuclease of toxin-antitoxin system